ncbi:MAG: hypothetical protein R3E97_19320 [Candidatus Eisenbacteria bacterium]
MSSVGALRTFPRLMAAFVVSLTALVAIGLTLPVAADATAGDWERIGVREVDGRVDHDVIPVTVADGRFQKIQLRVARAPMEIFDLKVHFGDGTFQDVEVRSKFAPGSSSRVIDLAGGDRVIEKVEFTYGNLGKSRKPARVVVWGMH